MNKKPYYDINKKRYVGDSAPTFTEFTLIDKFNYVFTRFTLLCFCVFSIIFFWKEMLIVGILNFCFAALLCSVLGTGNLDYSKE